MVVVGRADQSNSSSGITARAPRAAVARSRTRRERSHLIESTSLAHPAAETFIGETELDHLLGVEDIAQIDNAMLTHHLLETPGVEAAEFAPFSDDDEHVCVEELLEHRCIARRLELVRTGKRCVREVGQLVGRKVPVGNLRFRMCRLQPSDDLMCQLARRRS